MAGTWIETAQAMSKLPCASSSRTPASSAATTRARPRRPDVDEGERSWVSAPPTTAGTAAAADGDCGPDTSAFARSAPSWKVVREMSTASAVGEIERRTQALRAHVTRSRPRADGEPVEDEAAVKTTRPRKC